MQILNFKRIPSLADFEVICNNNGDRFLSIGIYSRPKICISSHTEVNGASLVTYVKLSFTRQAIKLLLLHKKYTLHLRNFCNWLQNFISSNSVDII